MIVEKQVVRLSLWYINSIHRIVDLKVMAIDVVGTVNRKKRTRRIIRNGTPVQSMQTMFLPFSSRTSQLCDLHNLTDDVSMGSNSHHFDGTFTGDCLNLATSGSSLTEIACERGEVRQEVS